MKQEQNLSSDSIDFLPQQQSSPPRVIHKPKPQYYIPYVVKLLESKVCFNPNLTDPFSNDVLHNIFQSSYPDSNYH